MRRTVVAALATGLVVMLSIVASGAAQGPGQGGDRTIVLYEKGDRGTFKFVDAKPFTRVGRNGPRRISAGDRFVFRSPLFSDLAATTRAGTLLAKCTAVNGSRRFDRVTFLCDATAILADGSINVAGAFKPTETPQTFQLGITGGTGAYEGAAGQITSRDLPNGDTEDTIHLLAPR